MFENQLDTLNETISINSFYKSDITLEIKREDRIHPYISGNKFRKLKYNVKEALNNGFHQLLSFGGAYSNHIAAVAEVGKLMGITTIGVIRGEELIHKIDENPTLVYARECGMSLKFVSREQYKLKTETDFLLSLKNELGEYYLLPEGGTNELAIKGCEEILLDSDSNYDYICTSVGTGGTLAGLIRSSKDEQQVLGFSALKGTFQHEEVKKYTAKTNYKITDSYCFGGYAKIDLELIRFINEFRLKTGIPLDSVYTGKMLFGIIDLLKMGYFRENSRILAIHTGGLQGIHGMNLKLKKKNLPLIEL